MRVVVTGAAGFIGSHAAEAFRERGDEVLGIDNVNDYYDQSQKERNIEELAEAGIPVERLDIRTPECRELMVRWRPDVIVHLAAMAGVRYSIQNPLLYLNVNVDGTQNILEAANDLRIPMVFGSSSSVYGPRRTPPFTEDDRVDRQVSPYAASKRSAELLCRVHYELNQLPVTCLRFFTVYGPRGRPDMAPHMFMKRMLEGETIKKFGDGSTARDYTYVADIVAGILAAADTPNGYSVYNLGNNAPITLNEFISTMEAVVGKKALIEQHPMQPGDVPLTCANISRAQADLGYAPKTPLKEGLTEQYRWLKQYEEEANENRSVRNRIRRTGHRIMSR